MALPAPREPSHTYGGLGSCHRPWFFRRPAHSSQQRLPSGGSGAGSSACGTFSARQRTSCSSCSATNCCPLEEVTGYTSRGLPGGAPPRRQGVGLREQDFASGVEALGGCSCSGRPSR